MTAHARPYEILRDEADAIGQRARAAAEFAGPANPISRNRFRMIAALADKVVRFEARRMGELEKTAGGEGQ